MWVGKVEQSSWGGVAAMGCEWGENGVRMEMRLLDCDDDEQQKADGSMDGRYVSRDKFVKEEVVVIVCEMSVRVYGASCFSKTQVEDNFL